MKTKSQIFFYLVSRVEHLALQLATSSESSVACKRRVHDILDFSAAKRNGKHRWTV